MQAPKSNLTKMDFRVPPWVKEEIFKRAKEKNKTPSQLIRRAIAKYFHLLGDLK